LVRHDVRFTESPTHGQTDYDVASFMGGCDIGICGRHAVFAYGVNAHLNQHITVALTRQPAGVGILFGAICGLAA
jgi:hypothetical protein